MTKLQSSLLCLAVLAAVAGCQKKPDNGATSDTTSPTTTTTTTAQPPMPPMPQDTSPGTAANPAGAPSGDTVTPSEGISVGTDTMNSGTGTTLAPTTPSTNDTQQ